MAEGVELARREGQVLVRRVRALGDDHDRRVPGLEPVLHVADHLVDVERALRDEDHVRAAGQAGVQRDPARVPAHDLDDQRPVVAFRRGVQPVDRLHGDVHRGVEAERVVGRAEVVVDGLRHADDGNALAVQPRRDAERVLAADHHERVHAQAGQVVLDPLDAVAPGTVLLERVRPRRAEDRAAARQDAAHRVHVQRHRVRLKRTTPAVTEPYELQAELLDPPAYHGADDRVQPRAIAAPGKHSHSHKPSLAAGEPACNGPRNNTR